MSKQQTYHLVITYSSGKVDRGKGGLSHATAKAWVTEMNAKYPSIKHEVYSDN